MKQLALVLVVTSAACVTEPGDVGSSESAIVENTPEAFGVLRLLADRTTTLAVLDDSVPLDRRAAENLIAHRDGADGVFGTADDDAFDTIAEVDTIPYVGPVALERLRAYAVDHGFVPAGTDVLGVFDDVAFTFDEAVATLDLVNTASFDELDVDVPLDRRAATNIVAARPIASMPALAAVSYVGPSAMLDLREYPKSQVPTGTAPVGQECSAHSDCVTGLCAGMLMPGLAPNGFCMPQDTAGTFSTSSSMAITDDGQSVISTIPVQGLLTVPLDVIVDLDISHPRKQDLVVVLHQPGGADAVLWNHEADPPSHIVAPRGIEGDNMVNGDWKLEITDTVSGEQGTLVGWSMWISSNWD